MYYNSNLSGDDNLRDSKNDFNKKLFKSFKTISFLLFILAIISKIAYSQTARIIDTNLNPFDLYFTGDAIDPKTWYQDAMGPNPDVGIELCGAGQKYVGAAYAMNVNGNWKSILITYRSHTDALAYTDRSRGGGCYYTSHGFLTVSPSYLSTPSPQVYFAAFPGRLFIAYENSPNPGNLVNLIRSDNMLRGDYDVERSFNHTEVKIRVKTPTIRFQSFGGMVSKSADDTTFGVSNHRRMLVGICSDNAGTLCHSGIIVPAEATFPLSLEPGVGSVDDKNKYDRFVVINGIGKPICIGANLKADILSINPDPVYYSQTLSFSFRAMNYRDTPYEIKGGNVPVTTDFKIRIRIYRKDNASYVVLDQSIIVDDNIMPGDSITFNTNWEAIAKSGRYILEIFVDSENDIVECEELDNIATREFELKPIILPRIWINGNETNKIPFSGTPYNLTMHLRDSDGLNVSNATVILIEENGIDSFIPLQIWNASVNATNRSTIATINKREVTLKSDYYGFASITIIPSGNPIYHEKYQYLNISSLIGNYSISLTGRRFNNETFVFIINKSVTNYYPIEVEDYYSYINSTRFNSYEELPNFSTFVDIALNTIYTIFAKFWKAVVG